MLFYGHNTSCNVSTHLILTSQSVSKDASDSFTQSIVQYGNISSIPVLAGAAFNIFI